MIQKSSLRENRRCLKGTDGGHLAALVVNKSAYLVITSPPLYRRHPEVVAFGGVEAVRPDAAVAVSTPRDHPGRGRTTLRDAADDNQARAVLVDAHRWLDELMTNSNQTTDTLAAREGKNERSIRMTLSLAFLPSSWAGCHRRSTASRLRGQAADGSSNGVV
jgi:hypothetical protein